MGATVVEVLWGTFARRISTVLIFAILFTGFGYSMGTQSSLRTKSLEGQFSQRTQSKSGFAMKGKGKAIQQKNRKANRGKISRAKTKMKFQKNKKNQKGKRKGKGNGKGKGKKGNKGKNRGAKGKNN